MPDSRSNRGAHPQDSLSFSERELPKLRAACSDLCWLLTHAYPIRASAELVGNRYALRARQRKAVVSCSVGEQDRARRMKTLLPPQELRGEDLQIDGYNVLLSVEAALGGGVILRACDGTYRDMAAMSGHYRRVLQTDRALKLVGRYLEDLSLGEVAWLLDQPVSNSGRLKTRMLEVARGQAWDWRIELVPNPDPILARSDRVIATADSGILDQGPRWLNLARRVIDRKVPEAWIVDLSEEGGGACSGALSPSEA